jgi:hypothetical protein
MPTRRTIALLLMAAGRLVACSCSKPTLCQLVERYPVIFTGEVIDGGLTSIRQDPWYADEVKHATFRVIEAFRGLPAGTRTVDVRLALMKGMCSPIPYQRGKRYLVAPHFENGIYSDGGCFSGRELQTVADEIPYLRPLIAGEIHAAFVGTAAPSDDASSIGYYIDSGISRPVAAVKVTARKGSMIHSALTGASGRYFLKLPEAGVWLFHAEHPLYGTKPEQAYDVPGGGCQNQNVPLLADNTLSGRLMRMFNGKPEAVGHVRVGLHEADETNPTPLDMEAYSDAAGYFEFKRVPLGRYRVAGPSQNRPNPIISQETGYYRGSSSFQNAKVIEVKSNHTHLVELNIQTGPPFKTRRVTVRAEFEDGTPMTTAAIRCRSLAEKVDWRDSSVTPKTGVVTFDSPATVPIEITLTDWYGRDLGVKYAATYPPGEKEIVHKFVVRGR